MSQIDERSLTEVERRILNKLLERPFVGSEEVKKQVLSSVAQPTGDSDNYGSIYLKTSSNVSAPVTSRVPVEGMTRDSDGVAVDVILHVVDGFINELEIVKADGSKLRAPIDIDNIEVTVR